MRKMKPASTMLLASSLARPRARFDWLTSTSRRWQQAALLALACFQLVGCDDKPERAPVINPLLTEQCEAATCSGHGSCAIDEELGGAMCTCLGGYVGDSCERCADGFHRDGLDNCSPDRACVDQPPEFCSNHGSCSDETGIVECRCETGYEGPRCNLCQATHGRNEFGECVLLSLDGTPGTGSRCASEECSSHGACDDSTGQIHCLCDAGYGGERCDICTTGFHRYGPLCVPDNKCLQDTCHGHGTCDDSRGVVQCSCDSNHRGARCENCAAGFHAEGSTGCVPDTACLLTTCNQAGTCAAADGILSCTCTPPFAGVRCESCTAGFHPNQDGLCVANEACQPDSCHGHGGCDDATGVIACDCWPGYTGLLCELCAPGFLPQEGGVCALNEQCQNPIAMAATHDFEAIAGFPTLVDNCVSGVDVDAPPLTIISKGLENDVQACGPSKVYGMPTRHVFVEATADAAAELRFSGTVAEIRFRYAARSDLSLDLVADGRLIGHLDAKSREGGNMFLNFDPAISKLTLRKVGGSEPTLVLALDNLSYAPPVCQ